MLLFLLVLMAALVMVVIAGSGLPDLAVWTLILVLVVVLVIVFSGADPNTATHP